MSWDRVQSDFAGLSTDGVNPRNIPDHYRSYYERAFSMFQKFRHFGGVGEIPHNYRPMICLLADQAKRIAELEERLSVKQAKTPAKPPETPESDTKIDMRTKEGRAMKAKALAEQNDG